MFVGVARLTLQIRDSGSLKAKRQVLRRVSDRVRARFNVAVAEVADNDLWQRAVLAFSVIGNEHAHVNEQVDKIIHFIEEMYVAPLISREMEILGFGEQLFAGRDDPLGPDLPFPTGDRTMAEAEGLGEFEKRHVPGSHPKHGSKPGALTTEERRARARSLRNPRDWEKP